MQSDRDRGFTWIQRAASAESCWSVIDADTNEQLLRDKMPALDPAELSAAAYACIEALFEQVRCSKTQSPRDCQHASTTVSTTCMLNGREARVSKGGQ